MLAKVVEAIEVSMTRANSKVPNRAPARVWVKEGSNVSGSKASSTPADSILDIANDWKIAADLPGRKAAYPDMVRVTGSRPDVVLSSESSRTIVTIELTVPYESNMSESHELKMAKYEGLKEEIQERGYKTHMFAVEVGARGVAGASVYTLLKRLGLSGQVRTRYLKQLAETAEKASYWIWLKRGDKNWTNNIKAT